MTETTRSTERSVSGATLMLACELGSTKWVLGFTTAPAQRPRIRTMAAGDLAGAKRDPIGKGAVWASARRTGAELLRSGPGWILAPPVVDRAARGERGGGFLEHRSQSAGTDDVATVVRKRCTMRGVAETSAAVFSAELFGTRMFRNGRQLGAVMGLVPVPYRSDQRVRDQGISKAGRGELHRIGLQLAW